MYTTRRFFLVAAASPFLFPIVSVRSHQSGAIRKFSSAELSQLRKELLDLINAERVSAGLSLLALDDLACLVADQHALDMAKGKFLSHWGTDGRKPYHRYGDAEGFDAVAENVSSADKIESQTTSYIGIMLAQMHIKMHGEVPPNDGHRRTILAPQHTHVGLGMALVDGYLRLVELYVGRYIHLETIPRDAKRKTILQVRGKVLNPQYELSYAEVFFEPLPISRGIEWLREPRPYSLPDEYRTIRLVAPEGTAYADGVTGEIAVGRQGRFGMPVYLYKNEPGIYTVVIYLSAIKGKGKFGATNICIRVS